MNTIMSVINGQTVASTQAVIEKRYPATGEVKIPPATLAMLDEAVRHAKAQGCEDGYFLSPAILIAVMMIWFVSLTRSLVQLCLCCALRMR